MKKVPTGPGRRHPYKSKFREEKWSYRTGPHGAPNCRTGKGTRSYRTGLQGPTYRKEREKEKKVHAGQGDTGFLIANEEKGKVCYLAGPHRVPNRRKGKGKRVLLDQATQSL